MQGWLKLHRQLLENPIFNSEPYSKGQAWVSIIALTNHKDGYITVKNGEMIKIERGECGYSELALSDKFKWSRGKVKRFLKLLESEKMIQQKIVANHSIIKILNYDKYQDDTTDDTTNGQQTIQQTDTNKNDNNDNNDKNELAAKKIDFLTDPIINEVFDIYRTNCTGLVKLDKFCNRNIELKKLVGTYLEQTGSDLDYFKRVCEIANGIKRIGSVNVDLKVILKNHDGFYNGKYSQDDEPVNNTTSDFLKMAEVKDRKARGVGA